MRSAGTSFFSASRPGAAGLRRQRAFTLLELLVATSVAAIVLLVINATFFGALRLNNTTHDRIDHDLEVQRAIGVVRRDLAGIMLPSSSSSSSSVLAGPLSTESSTSTSLDVSGGERITPDIYTSSGRVDGWTPFGDVQMVSYFLTSATDGSRAKSLVRVVTRNLLPVQDATTEEQTLLAGVNTAAIDYFDGTDWTDTWDSSSTSTLPSAIRFSLTLEPRDSATPNRTPGAPIEIVVPIFVMTTTSANSTTSTTGS